jgi:hypothetical protein
MSTNKDISILDELQGMLDQQLELAHQGNPSGEQMDDLCSRTDLLVERIVQAGILDLPELQCEREELRKRYECLCLIIAAQKDNVSKELNQIRKGRKTLGTYHRNI